jgi:hypothetical protein
MLLIVLELEQILGTRNKQQTRGEGSKPWRRQQPGQLSRYPRPQDYCLGKQQSIDNLQCKTHKNKKFLISKGMPRLRLTIRWLEQKRKTRITSNEGQAISVGASHSDLPKAHWRRENWAEILCFRLLLLFHFHPQSFILLYLLLGKTD